LNAFAMLTLVVLLGLCTLLMWNSSSEAVLYQLQGMFVRAVGEGSPTIEAVGRLILRWTGYLVGAGLMFLLSFSVHEETRKGNPSAYPLVAMIWTGVVVWGAGIYWALLGQVSWPGQPGMTAVLALFGALWLALMVYVLILWGRWWRERAPYEALIASGNRETGGVGSAEGLGRMGIVASFTACVFVVGSACGRTSMPGEWFSRARAVGSALWEELAFQIELLRVHL
jgi:hypothetical protein